MRRILLAVVLTCFLLIGTVHAWGGEGTVLDLSSLPENWVFAGDYLASQSDLVMFSNQLGVSVKVLRNYMLSTPQGNLQINLVVTETEEQAEEVYHLFLQVHSPEQVALKGCRVMEILTDHLLLVEQARSTLRFNLEIVPTVDAAVLREYLTGYSWPVHHLQTVTTQLRTEVEDYSIFLVGESHGMAINQELESALLEFFVTEGGVQNYLLELSPSVVGFLREYLETGDEDLLNFVFSSVAGTYFATEESYRHWRGVYDLYQSLPEDKQFSLLGVDVEHNPLMALQYLQRLIDRVESNELSETRLGEIARVLRGERSIYSDEMHAFLAGLLAELEMEVVRSELGSLVEEFELVLSGLLQTVSLPTPNGSLLWNAARDKAMYASFLKQADKDGKAKYFGQWGLNHVFQGEQMGIDWFASFVDTTETYEGAIFSMVLVYEDSHYLTSFTHDVLPFSSYQTESNLVGQLAAGKPLLMKLNGSESPFGQEMLWKIKGFSPVSGVTTDYYQYLLFMPGATPSTPWEMP